MAGKIALNKNLGFRLKVPFSVTAKELVVNGLPFSCFVSQKGNFVNVVRKAQAAAWEEKFMAMKAKQKESNKVSVVTSCFYTPTEAISVIFCGLPNLDFLG